MTSRKAIAGLGLVLCLLASMTLPLLPVEPALADATWQIQTVDSAGAKFTSLAFDSSGNPGISYYDGTNGDLKYAHWNGSSWDTVTVDSSGDVGMSSSLAFDSSGNAAISYVDISSHHLKLARFNGSSWAAAIIDDSGRVYDDGTSLAFDHTGNPAISYCYWEDVFLGLDVWYVRYAHFNGTSWDKSNVKGGTGVYVGRYNSLAFDASGNPSISYYNHGSYHLEYAHWTGLSWIVETIDSAGDVGMYTSLDFDLSGNPGISYYDYSNGNLKYAHWNDSAWSIETVDSAGAVGLYTSLAFDNAQTPAISYYDQSNGNLKYAYWSGVGWVIQAVDTTGDVGKFTSIAFDRQGNPGISYYDATNGHLKYAYLPLNQAPNQPSNAWPLDAATSIRLTPTLQSSPFSDPDTGDTHAASQWQITATSGDYSSPVFDSGSDGSNLTQISVTSGILDGNTTYYWRVRHQDAHGAWSEWSAETCFNTTTGIPQLEWHQTFGGPAKDYADSVEQTSDGGYIIVGQTESYGAGENDVWLIRTDSNGNELWNRTFGGPAKDYGESVQQTSDGGYIIAGTTASSGAGGPADVWLIKTDADGNKLWDKTFGGSLNDYGKSVQQTSDGGYIIVGDTWSSGAGEMDVWLIKTDSNGNKVWDKTFGSPDIDWGKSVQQTADGGYVVAAIKAHSADYEGDAWLIKTDSEGNKLWAKTFGGSDGDFGESVQQTSDGGYIIGGTTESYGAGGMDAWLIKTDSDGNMLWQQPFGGSLGDEGLSVEQTSDGGYIIGGLTQSYGDGGWDAWLIKTDSNGDKLWDKTFGGPNWDVGYCVQQTSDGGYVIAGYTVSYGAGDCDVWLLKVSNPPNQPSNVLPTDGATDASLTPTLQSSAFSDPDTGDTHAASQWQVTTTSGDYSSPVFDSSTDSSNLTAMSIPSGNLNNNTTYYWRLRHQDSHGAWSEWSSQTSFATIALTTIIVDPSILEEPAKYSFASAQGESELEVLPGGETEGVIYFYNVDGNRITHITLAVIEAPDNWEIEIDPPLHDIQVSFLGGDIIPVTENLHAEPTELSSEEIEDVPEGMICLTLPNKLGDGIPGYALARVATTIIRVPESAEIGTSSIKISATAFWVGQTGAAAISQDRDFDFTVEVKLNQPPSQPSNTWPLDGATSVSLPPILQSSAFSDPDSGDNHAASQWQITATSGYYSSPVFDSGTDTSKLTSITISSGTLQHAITYYWRVRHQDNNGNWSAWSDETEFTTEGMVVVDGVVDDEDESDIWVTIGAICFGLLLFLLLPTWVIQRIVRRRNIGRWRDEGYDF